MRWSAYGAAGGLNVGTAERVGGHSMWAEQMTDMHCSSSAFPRASLIGRVEAASSASSALEGGEGTVGVRRS